MPRRTPRRRSNWSPTAGGSRHGRSTCPPTTVVGVVGDVPYLGLATGGEGVYTPLTQDGNSGLHLVVRSTLGSAATFRALRSAIASLDPELAPVEVDMRSNVATKSVVLAIALAGTALAFALGAQAGALLNGRVMAVHRHLLDIAAMRSIEALRAPPGQGRGEHPVMDFVAVRKAQARLLPAKVPYRNV